MSGSSVFISYSHRDMEPTNWLDRLKLYLAPIRRAGVVDVWDDTRIAIGADWRSEIQAALDHSTASLLLVGPGFLASDFVVNSELPRLLAAGASRGTKVYPLVVAYCAYNRSPLERYQAFNDPEKPLEALTPAEQNRILNMLSLTVDADLRHASASSTPTPDVRRGLLEVVGTIRQHLENTHTAFVAQCRRRDQLVGMIVKRLRIKQMPEYENFFFRYYCELNDDERFQFEQIRAITEGPLYEGNSKIVEVMEDHPQVLDEIPTLRDLRQHLVFWLNKYDRVFRKRPEMCLLYTGVEDGVPFPVRVDKDVEKWIKQRVERPTRSRRG